MKRKSVIILFSVMVVFVLVAGFSMGLFTGENKENSGTWQTCEVTRQDMGSSVLATGIIKPSIGAEVRVGSRVSGIVKRLHVNIGDRVEKGQLLAELDQTEFKARYNQALAAQENARARLNFATVNLKRQQALKKKDFTSQNMVDEAERTYEVAESDLNEAKANLDYANIQLGYTMIQAPISGVVASVSTQEGETVAASFMAPTFVIIIDLERLEVWAYVDETDIGRIKKDQQVTFTVDTYPDIEFEGKVTAIYPKAEMRDNVVNYVTIIDITGNKGRTLRPEMTTTVKIFQETRPNVLVIPRQAIMREDGKKHVYVVKGTEPEKRQINTGWTDGEYIEVKKGLAEGEKIIIDKNDIDRSGN